MIISFSFGQIVVATAIFFVVLGLVVVVGMLRIRAKRVSGWRAGQARWPDEKAEG